MGNQVSNYDKSAVFEGGYLFVKCERPVYYPGNQVNGKIYLRVERPMNATKLDIQVQGAEKVFYVTHHSRTTKNYKG